MNILFDSYVVYLAKYVPYKLFIHPSSRIRDYERELHISSDMIKYKKELYNIEKISVSSVDVFSPMFNDKDINYLIDHNKNGGNFKNNCMNNIFQTYSSPPVVRSYDSAPVSLRKSIRKALQELPLEQINEILASEGVSFIHDK